MWPCQLKQDPDLIDLWQIFMEMAGDDFLASEAAAASKQPQKSNLTSDLKSVCSITCISSCMLFIYNGLFWQPWRPVHPPNRLRGSAPPKPRHQESKIKHQTKPKQKSRNLTYMTFSSNRTEGGYNYFGFLQFKPRICPWIAHKLN